MTDLSKPNRRTVLKLLGTGGIGATALIGTGTARSEGLGKYRDVNRAMEEGYEATPCVPGMGVHYINYGIIDDKVKISQPEALVYARDGDDLRYLGVEYLATTEFSLFNHHAHYIAELDLYGLHAWFFERNDEGKHAEFHARVDADCNYITD